MYSYIQTYRNAKRANRVTYECTHMSASFYNATPQRYTTLHLIYTCQLLLHHASRFYQSGQRFKQSEFDRCNGNKHSNSICWFFFYTVLETIVWTTSSTCWRSGSRYQSHMFLRLNDPTQWQIESSRSFVYVSLTDDWQLSAFVASSSTRAAKISKILELFIMETRER